MRTIQISQAPESPATLTVDLSVSEGRQGFTFTAVVRADGNPVSGAAVAFKVTDPSGSIRTLSATTSGSGVATASFKPRRKDPKGTYTVQAAVVVSGQTATATAQFVVN